MENTKTQTTKSIRVKMEEMKSMEKRKYKDIKSFNQLPTYVLLIIKELNNTYREPKLKYGGEVINTINPNDNNRWIYEVEYVGSCKSLKKSRMLWCVVETEGLLLTMSLGEDPIHTTT